MSNSDSTSVEVLFKEHSREEIEAIRDNLSGEIGKRTELLKSIVKEKYRDVVETSDAIQSMRLSLTKVENSIKSLDESISKFYGRLLENPNERLTKRVVITNQSTDVDNLGQSTEEKAQQLIKTLVQMSAELWEQFDAGNLKKSLQIYTDCLQLAKHYHNNNSSYTDDMDQVKEKQKQLISNLEKNLERALESMKNHLRLKISSAEPTQIGIIDNGNDDDDHDDLFDLSLQSSIELLIEKFQNDISDTSYHAQIRRYQPSAYFNSETNQIETQLDDLKSPTSNACYVQIPKDISIELSSFLYETSCVVNTISGFSLSKVSIREGLRVTLNQIIKVYSMMLSKIDNDLKGESKRRRAMQLYFDLMYVRVLLNSSKDIELIDELDSQISQLAIKYELLLDSVELYMVSEAMHTNVLKLIHSTIRLYGLLIPNLQ